MSLLWIDGFETYTTSAGTNITTILGARYTTSGTITSAASSYGGLCVTSAPNAYLQTPALTTNATLAAGFRFMGTAVVGMGAASIVQFYDGSTLGFDVQWNPYSQELSVYRGGTLLGTTSGAGITTGVWYHIDVQVLCSATVGTVTVQVAGVTVLALTGQNTKAGSDSFHNMVRFCLGNWGLATYFDAVYVLDGNGTVNNSILGPCNIVAALLPAGDSSVQWSTSAGTTHYSLVDEVPPDGDMTWVSSATSGQLDLFTYTSPAYPSATILGIQLTTTCRVTDANTFGLYAVVYSGSENDGTPQTISSTTYADYRRIVETDPNTGAAWTIAGLSAAKFGVKVQ